MKGNVLLRNSMVVALMGLLAAAAPARAGGIDDFSLAKAIPADAFMAIHARNHEGMAFVNKQRARVVEALEKAHFEKDIKNLLKGLNKGDEAATEEFEKYWQQFSDLLAGVDWSALGERESAFAMKLSFPAPEFVMLFKPAAGKVDSNFDGLTAILKALVALAPPNALALADDKQGDAVIRRISAPQLPFAITLARHKEVILIGLGTAMVEQSLNMLAGKAGQTLASTPRFQEAFKRLPAPTDELSFVDVAKLMKSIREIIDSAMKMAQAGGGEGPPENIKALPGKIIDMMDMFEYSAEVATTKGMKRTADSITVLRDDAKSHGLYAAFFGVEPVSNPLKYIPKNAGNMNVTSGINLLALYQTIIKFVREEIPQGKENIAEWEEQQKQIGFNVETDLLAWLQGQMGYFSIPGKTQFSPGEWVVMLRVRDEKKANEMIGRLLDAVGPLLKQQNGTVEEAKVGDAEGFHSFLHPMLGMVGMKAPTLGVKDSILFFGSSPEVIGSALDTAAGKQENFSKNERFIAEGIPPAAKVHSLSFTDTSKMGEELSGLCNMLPGIVGMAGGPAMSTPEVRAILNMVQKLGPVLAKLDFFLSDCSQSTFDGKVLLGKSVSNFREPPAPKAAPKNGTGNEKKDE